MNVRNGIENLPQIFSTQPAASASAAKTSNPSSSGNLGEDRAQLSAVATQASQSTTSNEVRLDKVASIQSALQAGTYQVSDSDVAKKVITSMLSSET